MTNLSRSNYTEATILFGLFELNWRVWIGWKTDAIRATLKETIKLLEHFEKPKEIFLTSSPTFILKIVKVKHLNKGVNFVPQTHSISPPNCAKTQLSTFKLELIFCQTQPPTPANCSLPSARALTFQAIRAMDCWKNCCYRVLPLSLTHGIGAKLNRFLTTTQKKIQEVWSRYSQWLADWWKVI